MSGRCFGCTNKYGFFEHPRLCPECKRSFCQTCLPNIPDGKNKKKSQPLVSQDPCVYCSKQKYISIVEEAEILDNFQDRFYKHSRTEPAVQSKLHEDLSKGVPSQSGPGEPAGLSEEDKALEKRLKDLKDSKNVSTPTYSEEEMREKLLKLRGESDTNTTVSSTSSTVPGTANQTQVDQAKDLIEKAADEVRLEERLDERNSEIEGDLYQRFQALKGKKDVPHGSASNRVAKPDIDISNFLEEMELVLPDEDSEKLLVDLQCMQHREEHLALAEAGASDIQLLISKAKELSREGETGGESVGSGSGGQALIADLANITYPNLESMGDSEKPNNSEVKKLLTDVVLEIADDKEKEKDDNLFIQEAGERLLRISNDKDDGGVVRSKVNHPQEIDISWTHFGDPSSHTHITGGSGMSAARELGLRTDVVEGDESDTEIQALIDRIAMEARLDERLEASGLKVNQVTDKPTNGLVPAPSGAGCWSGRAGDEEFPWCCICNEDATVQCRDCDDDLYCTHCFSEGHEQFGLFDHQYAPYEPKKQ